MYTNRPSTSSTPDVTPADIGAVPTSRTVAGAALTGDVSAATIASALGLGAVTATGANAAAARAAIDAYSTAQVDAADAAVARAAAVPWVLPLCSYATNDGPLTAVGRLRFDPALFARAGLTLAAALEIVGDVSAGGLTGTVELYDLTAAATAATLSWTETSATVKTASVTVPGAAHTYELRASLSGGAGYLTLGGAVLRLTWS